MKKFFICAHPRQFLDRPGYDNYLLVQPGEKGGLNPVYMRRIEALVKENSPVILVARTKVIAAILEAVRVPYEVLYV